MAKSLKQLLLIGLAVLLCAASLVACDVEAPETPSAPNTMPSVMPMQALLWIMLLIIAFGDILPPSALLSAARNTV